MQIHHRCVSPPASFALVLVFLCLSAIGATAQYETALQTGQVPFQSYDINQIDSINLQNGNVSVQIPLLAYPQLGDVLKLSFSATYGSESGYAGRVCPSGGNCDYVWEPTGTAVVCCSLNGYLNPSPFTVAPDGYYGTALNLGTPLIKTTSYLDVNDKNAYLYYACSGDGCHKLLAADNAYRSIDATGISANLSTGQVLDKRGVQYTQRGSSSGVIARDPYGNTISYSSTTGITDTIGRTFSLASSTDSTGCAVSGTGLSVIVWSLPGPNGGRLSFKVCTVTATRYRQIPPSSPAATTTIYGPTSQSLLLPDGRSWIFQYNGAAGELTQITLPTGGTISYTYASQPDKSGNNWSRYVNTRTVSDGTHSYTWHYGFNTSSAPFTTVTTPNGDDIVHQFQCLAQYNSEPCDGFYETSVKYYKGSSTASPPVVLRTETTTYNYSGINFCVWQVPCVIQTINVTPASKTVTLDDGSTSSNVAYAYDSSYTISGQVTGSGGSYGDLMQQLDYDYGGSLLRKTANTYLFQSNSNYKTMNMLDLIQSTTVYNGSSQQVAKTTYGYDEGVSSLTGSNTSIQKWLNTTNHYCPVKGRRESVG